MGRDPLVVGDERPAGCGVQGCLVGAVALFVILLLWLVFIMFIRFGQPPEPRFGSSAVDAPAAMALADTPEA